MVHALRPRHLGDVHETLHARFQLDKRAVRDDVDHLALDPRLDGILLLDVLPRARGELLEAEGDLFGLLVHLQDHDLDLVFDGNQLGRVADAAPAHVRDVQQAVDAAQVHERAEVGDILDDALARLADLDFLHQLYLHLLALFLDELAARDDDVASVLVDLQDFARDGLSDIFGDVAGAADVHLRGRQEYRDADVHKQPALDLAHHRAAHNVVFLVLGDDLFPSADAVGFSLGKLDEARIVLDGLQQHLYGVTHRDLRRVLELVQRNDSFGLVSHVHDNVIIQHVEDASLENRPHLEALRGLLVEVLQVFLSF